MITKNALPEQGDATIQNAAKLAIDSSFAVMGAYVQNQTAAENLRMAALLEAGGRLGTTVIMEESGPVVSICMHIPGGDTLVIFSASLSMSAVRAAMPDIH